MRVARSSSPSRSLQDPDTAAFFDEWGAGRFDVVGWDPRGANRSSPVECFTSQAAEDRFWAGVSVPITPAESASYQRKTVEPGTHCQPDQVPFA
jgi:hypothetical protein